MKSFDYPLLQLNEFEQVKVCLSEHKSCQVTGCGESQLAHFINGLSNGYKQKVIVTFSATKASQLYQDLKGFADDVVMYLQRILFSLVRCTRKSYIATTDLNLFKK